MATAVDKKLGMKDDRGRRSGSRHHPRIDPSDDSPGPAPNAGFSSGALVRPALGSLTEGPGFTGASPFGTFMVQSVQRLLGESQETTLALGRPIRLRPT